MNEMARLQMIGAVNAEPSVIPICIQDGDRGGSEEPHPQAGTRAYYEYVEESDAATTKVYT